MKSSDFVVSLTKNPPKTIAKMLLKAQKYMNVEDALAAIKDNRGIKEERRTIAKNKKGSVQTNG